MLSHNASASAGAGSLPTSLRTIQLREFNWLESIDSFAGSAAAPSLTQLLLGWLRACLRVETQLGALIAYLQFVYKRGPSERDMMFLATVRAAEINTS